ncbi:hypothetical protein J2S43_007670 [Catenuloplanes nepalensis]|uniref:2TM domain-containing protein n=1 Tax=Catenuloplanes nepalensis TaxID=587533 RepID=A0ABT9N6K7_9ACTN|nr:hypothetical protein [Catenuloplanes nepalensis]MDP9799158.1 hypothetical protein [Catenuloplanes nepalensis]
MPEHGAVTPEYGAVTAAVPDWPIGPDGRYLDATRRWLIENWAPYLGVIGVVVAVWGIPALANGGELGPFWPAWVAGPWGAFLLIATLAGLANGEPQRWAAKQARKHRLKAEDGDADE